MLPLSTARPPSLENGFSAERMTPALRSRSSSAQRFDCEKACVVRTPPGAAMKNWRTFSLLVREMSHWSSASPMVTAWTVGSSRLIRPARSSWPRIAMMPPARCTSSMCTSFLAGATLQSTGTLRRQRVDVVEREVDAALVGRREDVQHGVGRAAHGDVERHGVLERLLGGDGARQRALVVLLVVAACQVDDEMSRLRRRGACGRNGWRASSRCRAATGRAPRSGSSSSWR